MLSLTETARVIVRDITTSPGAPEDAGLRITPEPGRSGEEEAFAITAADEPGPDDRVVLHEGATVYLDPEAAVVLDDKLLDVSVDDDGGLAFAVRPQPHPQPHPHAAP